jgi:hypothetical protein
MRRTIQIGVLALAIGVLGGGISPRVGWGKELPAREKEEKVPRTIGAVLRLAKVYLAQEARLQSDGVAQNSVGAELLVVHWRNLRALRLGYEALEADGALERLSPRNRTQLRHVLAQVLGKAVDIELQGDTTFQARVVDASEERSEDLLALTQLANRSFDFQLQVNPELQGAAAK